MFKRLFRNRFGRNRSDGDQTPGSGRGSGVGGGRGRGNKPGSGPGGNCVCPQCGYSQAHLPGQRCFDQKCPQCGNQMIRE